MEISEVLGLTGNTNTETTKPGNIMGKDDFLNLLLKQLSMQDPLNPLDNTEFTSQLSQFTTIEELNNINTTLSDMLAFQNSMQNATLSEMIGKSVTTEGNTFYMEDSSELQYELSGDAASVQISVFSSAGSHLWSKDIGPQFSGNNIYNWDGKDAFGNQLPAGTYVFEVNAIDSSGNAVNNVTSSTGDVTGIEFKDNVTYLILEGKRQIHLSDIKTIEERRN